MSGVYARAVNRFSATRAGSWTVRHVAAKVDPKIFRATGWPAVKRTIPQMDTYEARTDRTIGVFRLACR